MNSPHGLTLVNRVSLCAAERLAVLGASDLLDSSPLPGFDRVTRLARATLQATTALFCVVTEEGVTVKARCGDDETELEQETLEPLCRSIVEESEERSLDRLDGTDLAFAGFPVQNAAGYLVGVLCVLDQAGRMWSERDRESLFDLSQSLESEIHLREEMKHHAQSRAELRSHQSLRNALQDLVQLTPHPVAVLDERFCYLAYSRRWAHDFRLQGRPLTGLCHFDVFRELPALWRNVFERCLQGESFRSHEDCFIHADDGREWVDWEVHPWHQPDGSVGGVVVLNRVHTEEREHEARLAESLQALEKTREELAESHRLLAHTQRLARVTRWSWDWTNDTVVCHHDGAQILMGLDEQRFNSLSDFLWSVSQDSRKQFEETLLEARRRQCQVSTEFALRVRGQKKSNLFLEAVVSRGPDGEALGLVGSIQDITPQREMETRLQQSQKNEALGRLAGGIAHDFRNILCAIHGFTDLAGYKVATGGTLDDELDEVRRAAKQAEGLVQQLVYFSRRQSVNPEVLRVAEVLEGCRKIFSHMSEDSVQLELRVPDDLPLIEIERGALEQLIINLLNNARDAINNEGRIEVEAESVQTDSQLTCLGGRKLEPGSYLSVTVRDEGKGISLEQLRSIFEPGFTTKASGMGSGLGLSVCDNIVTQAGGAMRVTSQPGQGSAFTVYLPVSERPQGGKPNVCTEESLRHLGGRVVLVEPDTRVQAQARRLLDDLGFTVKLFADPVEARKWLRQGGQAMLLISELDLPGLNGVKLAAAARACQPNIATLFLSEDDEATLLDKGLAPTTEKLLRKPFNEDDLREKLVQTLL